MILQLTLVISNNFYRELMMLEHILTYEIRNKSMKMTKGHNGNLKLLSYHMSYWRKTKAAIMVNHHGYKYEHFFLLLSKSNLVCNILLHPPPACLQKE